MSIARVKASSLTQGLPKRKTILAGNSTILPGSYESIATVTVGAGGQSSISFTSIPSTYTHLQIRANAQVSTSAANMSMRFNSDSTAGNYNCHWISTNGSAVSSGSGSGSGVTNAIFSGIYVADANIFTGQVIDILDYANTNKYKTVRLLTSADRNGLANWLDFSSGLWLSTSAISTITITNNFTQYTSFALYGIK